MPETLETMSVIGLSCPRCEGVIGAISCVADTIYAEGEQYAPLPHSGEVPCVTCGTPPGGLHHVGCDKQRCPRCGELLMAGCQCERSREIHTQLPWYARHGNLDAVKLLVLDGVPLDSRNRYGHTSLYEAVLRDHFETTKFLLKAGADPNEPQKGGSIIAQAARIGSQKIVELLLDYGARLDGGVLLSAAESNNSSLVLFLLEHDADIEERAIYGGTPLIHSVGLPAMVDLLASCGANVNAVDNEGRTALDWAEEDDWENPLANAYTTAVLLKWGAHSSKDLSEGCRFARR